MRASSSSSSTPRPQSPDVQRERAASKCRLLDVWSTLAERYTRRLDEDDIVDIRTGEITHDRGFFRNSRKVDFGAITAPVTGDVTTDEDTGEEEEEDEYGVDELDAFADATTPEIKNEIGLRARPVPPLTTLEPADAEDLRAFLEAEQRRKQLCGSEVEAGSKVGSEVEVEAGSEVEAEAETEGSEVEEVSNAAEASVGSQIALYVDSASEDELDNWDIGESSVVHPVLKREDNDSDIEIIEQPNPSPLPPPRLDLAQVLKAKKSTGNDFTSHISPNKSTSPYVLLTPRNPPDLTKSKTKKPPLQQPHPVNTPEHQSSPRKRKRVASDSETLFAVETSVMSGEKSERHVDKKPDKAKWTRRSSSRSQRRRRTPKSSVSGSGSESGNSSDSERGYSRKPYRSHRSNFQLPHHYPYLHHHQSYTPSPYRKQQQHHPPAEMFAPPMPDPRAQFIITQAMQQLSALVGTPWTPPHNSSIPYTPTRRNQSRRASSIFNTPSYHPHPYPYSYDPNLSLATLPPESPESVSSPEKSSHGPRKSSVSRSRSRGRRVSFKIDDNESGDDDGRGRVDIYSSPSNIPASRRKAVREQGRRNSTKASEGKGEARAETPNSGSSSEDPPDCGNDKNGKSYLRGRTPGPNIGLPKRIKHGQNSKGRLKST